MRARNRNSVVLVIILAIGLIIGGLIGDLLSDKLPILGYSYPIGFTQPIHLDLSIIDITFGFMVDINLASAIGLIIALIIYKKL